MFFVKIKRNYHDSENNKTSLKMIIKKGNAKQKKLVSSVNVEGKYKYVSNVIRITSVKLK